MPDEAKGPPTVLRSYGHLHLGETGVGLPPIELPLNGDLLLSALPMTATPAAFETDGERQGRQSGGHSLGETHPDGAVVTLPVAHAETIGENCLGRGRRVVTRGYTRAEEPLSAVNRDDRRAPFGVYASRSTLWSYCTK